jgi:hypothetical protein
VGAQLEQNFQLEIGSARETVTVEAAEPLVNTISDTLSSVVTGLLFKTCRLTDGTHCSSH